MSRNNNCVILLVCESATHGHKFEGRIIKHCSFYILVTGFTEHIQNVTANNYSSLTVTHSKDHCNYGTHKAFSVFTSRCVVVASNGGRCPWSGFPNCARPQLPTSHNSNSQLKSKTELYYDRQSVGQSVLVSSCIWGLRPDFYYCQTLRPCSSGAPSLTRRRVCRLQLLQTLKTKSK
jgi:hypothetical protein